MPSVMHSNFRLRVCAADPGQDAFTWDIDWDDGTTSTVTAQFIGGVAEADITHDFAGNAAEYTITIGADGVPEDTVLPQPLNAARGAEQTHLFHAWFGGGADGTIDIAGSSVKLKSQYTNSSDAFGGHSNVLNLPIGSDIRQSVINAMQGQIVVNREGYDGQDSFVEYDHTLQWPDDFNITVEAHHGIYFDSYTVTYVVDEPEQEWTEDGISWRMRAHSSGTVNISPVQIENSMGVGVNDSINEGSPWGLAFDLGRTNSSGEDGPLTVSFKIGGDAVYGQRYTFEVDTTRPESERLILTPPGNGGRMTVTFPAGVTCGQLFVIPIDDDIPQWTERITMTLADPDLMEYVGSPDPHVMEIVDDNDLKLEMQTGVLIANFNDSDDSNVPDYLESGCRMDAPDPELYELKLTFPAQHKKGAQIWLTGPVGMVRFWPDQAKTAPAYENGRNEVLWIDGLDNAPTKVYVEFLHGGNITLSLRATDATADVPPVYPTNNTIPISRSVVGIHVYWTDPYTGVEIESGNATDVSFIGHRLQPRFMEEAPANYPVNSIKWTVSAGPIFDHWNVSNLGGTLTPSVIPVKTTAWGTLKQISYVPLVGNPGASFSLAVSLGGITLARTVVTPVCEPTWMFAAMRPVGTGYMPATGDLGPLSTVFFFGTVDAWPTTQGQSASWYFLQTVRPSLKLGYVPALTSPLGLSSTLVLGGMYDADGLWHVLSEWPKWHVDPTATAVSNMVEYSSSFRTYQMFRPEGPLGLTEWVPLSLIVWSFRAIATRSLTWAGRTPWATPAVPASFTNIGFSVRTTIHPTWTVVYP